MKPTMIRLYAVSMGKMFEVTHIISDVDQANAIMETDPTVSLIEEDGDVLYLAKCQGVDIPKPLLEKINAN